jgi:pSer/pThr/pTyr-binding forkhead associated (FHA) protein
MATDGGDDSSDDGGETTRTVSPTVESQHTGLLVQLVLHDGQHVKLIPDMHLVIGRRGKSKKNNCHAPDVDLEPYDGYDAGVSRQHALLAWRDDSYVLEDLKSLNGTFVNGTRLSPGEAVAIHDGDYVQFGTLQAQVQVGGAQTATSTSMRAA